MDDRFILTPYFLDEPLPELEAVAEPGWQINRPNIPDGEQQLRMAALYESLADKVAQNLESGFRPISIAGDCCSAIGVVAGLQWARIASTLIWLDAHGDFNTWETTPSGFLGGMPLAMLVGRGDQTMPDAVGLQSLAEERVLVMDARDLDPAESLVLLDSKVEILAGVADLIKHPLPDMPMHVHFDTDIIDPAEAPAMNFPAPGGPSVDELQEAFRHLARRGNVIAVSMSTWNPRLDNDGNTGQVCMRLLQSLLEDGR
jgi:arginase